jgi:hypothetical protein
LKKASHVLGGAMIYSGFADVLQTAHGQKEPERTVDVEPRVYSRCLFVCQWHASLFGRIVDKNEQFPPLKIRLF